jgi:molecular chaperone GrpE
MARDKEIRIKSASDDEPEENASAAKEPESSDNNGSADKEQATEEIAQEEKAAAEREAELEDKLLRLAADFDNYRKRSVQLFEDASKQAADRVLADLLEVVDNFERALAHTNDESNDESLVDGTRMIHRQMLDLLKRHRVEPIEAVGQPFDPNLHDALMQVESDEYDEGVVAQEVVRGYKIHDRVLRHSKVAVSRGATSGDDPDSADRSETKNDK